MAKAIPLLDRRIPFEDGSIMQLRLFRVPTPVLGSVHDFKYSLFYGRPGARLIGYDNERGKGDHRHCGDREEPYSFTSVEQLMTDFLADVEKLRR